MQPTLSAETHADSGNNPTAPHLDVAVFSRGEWFALFLVGLALMLGLVKWLLSHTVKGYNDRLEALEKARSLFQTKEDAEVKYEALATILGEIKGDGQRREDRLVGVIESHRTEARGASNQIISDVREQGRRIDQLYQQEARRAPAGLSG